MSEIKNLKKTKVAKIVAQRLKEFKSFRHKNSSEWFSELCFCILTANSKAKTALAVQSELGSKGFCSYPSAKITQCIKNHKHRFPNTKTSYIIAARKYLDIKDKLEGMGSFAAREWLVRNIKGLGCKEASHFLRNAGFQNLAIIDRHILSVLQENRIISNIPKPVTKSDYLQIEKKLAGLAEQLSMSQAELDLYLWYMKTGEVLK